VFFRKQQKPTSLAASSPASRPGTSSSPPSVIGRNTRFRGEVSGRGPLRIQGQVKGIVSIDERLTVEQGGLLEADSLATEVVVAGTVSGNLQARRSAALRATGRVEGNLRALQLRVEEGAILKGTVIRDAESA
jgi:cytoskeletal protein CcmA (bactofilin family)